MHKTDSKEKKSGTNDNLSSGDEKDAEGEAGFEQIYAQSVRPYPRSRKVYVDGSRPDIRVPMREIAQSPSLGRSGNAEINPPIYVYDTSGPYTDPLAEIDLYLGLPSVRSRWIEERRDTEALPCFSSQYTQGHLADQETAALRFPGLKRQPRRAKPGMNV
ncbi:MAG: hypothetical protein EKK46_04955, partial [Rhodocyclaceae bacterium]